MWFLQWCTIPYYKHINTIQYTSLKLRKVCSDIYIFTEPVRLYIIISSLSIRSIYVYMYICIYIYMYIYIYVYIYIYIFMYIYIYVYMYCIYYMFNHIELDCQQPSPSWSHGSQVWGPDATEIGPFFAGGSHFLACLDMYIYIYHYIYIYTHM